MKKLSFVILSAAFLLLLSACGSGNDTSKESSDSVMTTKETTDPSSSEADSSDQATADSSVFMGTLAADATDNEGDGNIRLVLTAIEAVDDPDTILPMMENDGVVLNATKDQLADGLTIDQLKNGDKIKFTLSGTPIMTMSIPPQIPGNSIKLIEQTNE